MRRKNGFQTRFWIVAILFFLELVAILTLVSLFVARLLTLRYFWIVFIVIILIDIIAALYIIGLKIDSSYKISWLVTIIILPLLGVILFLIFSNKLSDRRIKRNKYSPMNLFLKNKQNLDKKVENELMEKDQNAGIVANYLFNNGFANTYKNTEVEYYPLGDISFKPMLEELKKAKRFIFIEYFIIQQGRFFDQIFNILKDKAKEGVDVRMIYDDFGCSSKVASNFYAEVRTYGIKCYPFNNLRPILDVRQNSRNHRKLLIIDGIVGFTGGINLADEYINVGSKFGHWKDNCIMLKGEAVNSLTNIFLSIWYQLINKNDKYALTEDHHVFSYKMNEDLDIRTNKENNGYVIPYQDTPFDGETRSRNVFLEMISRASKSVYISTPYLILDETLINALTVAAKSGVDVNIVTPGIPDKKIVYACTRSYYNLLVKSGVKIYEYTPGFNHAKMITIDGKYAEIGTINFDFRSMYLHFENGVYLYGLKAVRQIEQDLQNMISVSTQVDYKKYTKPSFFSLLIWALLRVIAPLF